MKDIGETLGLIRSQKNAFVELRKIAEKWPYQMVSVLKHKSIIPYNQHLNVNVQKRAYKTRTKKLKRNVKNSSSTAWPKAVWTHWKERLLSLFAKMKKETNGKAYHQKGPLVSSELSGALYSLYSIMYISGSDVLYFIIFMWFAALLCEPQSIWRKLLLLSWLYWYLIFKNQFHQ